jgi:hypothetical protein
VKNQYLITQLFAINVPVLTKERLLAPKIFQRKKDALTVTVKFLIGQLNVGVVQKRVVFV